MADASEEDEFRANLYTTLQRKGMVDTLKSQLRNALVKELQSSINGEQKPYKRLTLDHKVANSLIVEYLQTQGYEYSLSTLLAEARIDINNLLSPDEVCQVVRLSEQFKSGNKDCALLNHILKNMSLCEKLEKTSQEVQTECLYGNNVLAKGLCDEERIEKRMLAFQRDCESRIKRTYELQIDRFKEKELAVMRLEERQKYLKETNCIKDQLERKYQEKICLLSKEVEDERERLQKKEAELEHSLFSKRQTLLNEMDSLKLRESELRRQSELDRKALALEKDKAVSLQKLVQRKEEVMADLNKQNEEIAKAKFEKYKLELTTKEALIQNEIKDLKMELEAQNKVMSELRHKHTQSLEDLNTEREKVKELHKQLHIATETQTTMLKANNELQQKVKETIDYPSFREKLKETEKQLLEKDKYYSQEKINLETQLKEQENVIKDLSIKMEALVNEQTCNQHRFEDQIKKFKSDNASLLSENKHLKQNMKKKVEVIACMKERLNEVTVDLHTVQSMNHDLHEYIDSLHSILTSTNVNLLPTNKTNVRSKIDKSHTFSTPPSHVLTPILPTDSFIVNSSLSQTGANFSDSSAQILAEARATFARMEKESEELAKLYSFDQPVTNSMFPLSQVPVTCVPSPITLTNESMQPVHLPNLYLANSLPVSNLPVVTTSHVTNLTIVTTSPVTNLPVVITSHVTNLPVVTTSPVTNLPVVTTSPITNLPVLTTSPVTNLTMVTTSPVTNLPAVTTSPVTNLAVVTTSFVTNLPVATTSPVTNLPIVTSSPVTNLPVVTTSPVTNLPIVTSSPVSSVPYVTSTVNVILPMLSVPTCASTAATTLHSTNSIVTTPPLMSISQAPSNPKIDLDIFWNKKVTNAVSSAVSHGTSREYQSEKDDLNTINNNKIDEIKKDDDDSVAGSEDENKTQLLMKQYLLTLQKQQSLSPPLVMQSDQDFDVDQYQQPLSLPSESGLSVQDENSDPFQSW